jgi:hypothetical protein
LTLISRCLLIAYHCLFVVPSLFINRFYFPFIESDVAITQTRSETRMRSGGIFLHRFSSSTSAVGGPRLMRALLLYLPRIVPRPHEALFRRSPLPLCYSASLSFGRPVCKRRPAVPLDGRFPREGCSQETARSVVLRRPWFSGRRPSFLFLSHRQRRSSAYRLGRVAGLFVVVYGGAELAWLRVTLGLERVASPAS